MVDLVNYFSSLSDEDDDIRETNIFRRNLRDISNPLELPAHM